MNAPEHVYPLRPRFAGPVSREERRAGLVYARAWRIRTRSYFDAIHGPETDDAFCRICGQPLPHMPCISVAAEPVA